MNSAACHTLSTDVDYTLLHTAAVRGRTAVVEALLAVPGRAAGALDAYTGGGSTALGWAV